MIFRTHRKTCFVKRKLAKTCMSMQTYSHFYITASSGIVSKWTISQKSVIRHRALVYFRSMIRFLSGFKR